MNAAQALGLAETDAFETDEPAPTITSRTVARRVGPLAIPHDDSPQWLSFQDEHGDTARLAARMDLHETDLGNVERAAIDWPHTLRYVPGPGWHVWDQRRWLRDDSLQVDRHMAETIRLIRVEAKCLMPADDDTSEQAKEKAEKAKKRITWATRSENAPRVHALLDLARAHTTFNLPVDRLDTDPWALNVANGTIDLRTGELRPHRQDDHLTRLVDVAYDPDTPEPRRFMRFLDEITLGDRDLSAFIARAVGYTLTGSRDEQVFFIAHGEGANGKSTLLQTLVDLLGGQAGGYAATVDPATFTTARADQAARPDLARLRGARMALGDELEQGARLAEALVKRWTGGEQITARFLYREEFTFTPQAKIWLSVNHLPTIASTDHAIWRRIRVLPFKATFTTPDLHLRDTLRGELPGILAWAVRGCLDAQSHGLGTCHAVDEAAGGYRRQQDRVARFVAEVCAIDPDATIPNADLEAAFHTWATQNPGPQIGERQLRQRLTAMGHTTVKTTGGTRVRQGLHIPAVALSGAGNQLPHPRPREGSSVRTPLSATNPRGADS